MAHQVESMMYAGETPWHGLGTKVDEAPTSADAIRLAGLDWDVVQAPVSVGGVEVKDFRANVRSTDGKVLGITSDRYVPVQNREAFDFTDGIVGGDVRYETAGSLREGKLVWLLARLGGRKIVGDDVEQYLTFVTGHDGKTPVRVLDTSTRVVCANTLALAVHGARRIWTFEHASGVHDKLREASETVRRAREYMDALELKADEMHAVRIDDGKLDRILNQVFGDPAEFKEQQFKARRIMMLRDRLMEVYAGKDDLQNHRGTAWGLYNAFADVAAHATPTYYNDKRAKEKRFLSYVEGNELLKAAQKAIELVAA